MKGAATKGRRPKPTAIRQLEGNRGKRAWNHDEPEAPDGIPRCPNHLAPAARTEWRRVARVLYAMGVLTLIDRAALAAYCQSYAKWVEAEHKLKETPPLLKTPSGYVQQSPWVAIANKQLELMGRYMTELGMTPASRSRVADPRMALPPTTHVFRTIYEATPTARQGASGLGIAAQRQAIEGYAEQRGATILARFTEVESGRCPDRPELGRALHLAKVTGATLVIAKLDRLSRNAAFLLTLRDSDVRFSAVDLPEANDLTVGIMALVAQQEREAISRRTREALAVAKARGVRLGNPHGAAALRRAGKGGAPLRAAIARNADRHAQNLAPVVYDIRAGGATSLRAIAAELNGRGMLTRRGGQWHVSTVMNLLDRLGLRVDRWVSPG